MEYEMTRRKFLWLTSMAVAGVATGCAVDPVTGKSQLMLMSEGQEIQIDKKESPHQFSADYGKVQDAGLNNYVNQVGMQMAVKTHRPNMPYSFRVVNATYVNAYAFPGGSIAATRGILLTLDNEAELASLLGHELGHVNARHTAEQMSKGMLAQAAVSGVAVYAGTQGSGYGNLAASLGMISAGALLASYSRDNEREADDLGMKYMVQAGYSPKGFVGLMDMLKGMLKRKPNAIEMMFATHPMSEERYETAIRTAEKYRYAEGNPLYRERYMDNTADLRARKGAIKVMQKGESAMAKGKFREAEVQYKKALKEVPDDYAGLVMMSKCQLSLRNEEKALRYAEEAEKVYPQEAQAYSISGFTKIKKKDFQSAYEDFNTYGRLLPGNPNTLFLKGYALEGMQQTDKAANQYVQYLQVVQEGDQASHAYRRLVEWGYLKR